MPVGGIGVDDASTPDHTLHVQERTISGTLRADQYVVHGWSGYPTYSVVALGVTGATAASHVVQVMGDGTTYSRLVRVRIWADVATAATQDRFTVVRLSTAGTGGSAATVAAYDEADTYAGAARSAITASKGTEGATLATCFLLYPTTTGTPAYYEWTYLLAAKPIVFGPAITSGIAVKNASAITGALVDVHLEFVTTSYLGNT